MPVKAVGPTRASRDGGSHTQDQTDIDPNDPRVKKLVYSMYRDMLTSYNPDANKIIAGKDPRNVYTDHGIAPILECIIRGGGSSAQTGGGGGGSDSPGGDTSAVPSNTGGSSGGSGPPPPPPMAPPGVLPSMRLNSEIGPRDRGPPAALANAMMKDKKPFTYTPGGIDLSEIRSPRMAKRLAMNAQAEGVTSVPSLPANHPSHNMPPHVIPPAALAAMQPQLAVSVFPQGPIQHMNRNAKPSEYTHAQATGQGGPPPPPPPPSSLAPPAPPKAPPTHSGPPAERPKTPVSLSSALNEAFAAQRGARVAQNAAMAVALQAQRDAESNPNTPPVVQGSQGHPLQNIQVTQARPQPVMITPTMPSPVVTPVQQQQRSAVPVEVTRRSASPPSSHVGQGSIYIPPLQDPYVAPRPASPRNAKAAGLGSIYIPPVEQPQQQMVQRPPSQPLTSQVRSPPPPVTPATPTQLNKAPTPWMNSYNKMAQQGESPPYVNPGNVVTPWGVMTPGPSSGGGGVTSPPAGMVRTIPISIQREEPQSPVSPQGDASSKASAAQHLGRVIPIQIQRQESVQQSGARNIPIQIEGRQGTVGPGGRRVAGPPTLTYSNPPMTGFGAQGELMSGMHNMSMGGPRMEPVQSKSMRVIHQAAENDVDNFWAEELRKWGEYEQPYRRMESMDNDNAFTYLVGHQGYPQQQQQQQQHSIQIRMTPQSPTPMGQQQQVPASEQRTPEPRKYMGSSIPSRSFKMLQALTADDADPDAGLEGSSADEEVGGLSCSSSSSSCTSDPSLTFDPSQLAYDPYSSYMSWYYWWYYLSCYWSGYDMTGYEMPEGWDPENPYWPPEWGSGETPPEEAAMTPEEGRMTPSSSVVPQRDDILSLSGCDKQRGTDEEETYWSCDDDQLRQTEEEEEDEQTEGEGDEEGAVGVVEEPETPVCSSADDSSDTGTLVDEGGVVIEEVGSDLESNGGRLSTIEEVSSWSSSDRGKIEIGLRKQLEELEDDEEDEESSEEESVIENKSGGALSESKREDWTTSSSSSEDSEEDGGKEEEAVTFRLPLKLSFGKTKSYKDITTVFVGEESKEEEPAEEEEPEEAVVSFTINLSRQSSREEKEEEVVVDFWGQIIGKEEEPMKEEGKDNGFQVVEDFWGSAGKGEDEKEEAEPVVVVLRKKPPMAVRDEKRPASVSGAFNFWDKPPKTFESRRFSGNFEISEDYESDSGMKSDCGGSGEAKKRQKKFTRTAGQKRHSIPAGLPICLRNFGRKEQEEDVEVLEPEEPEVKMEEVEAEDKPTGGVVKSETTDLSAGWSYWDDLENAGSKPVSPSLRVEDVDIEPQQPQVLEPQEIDFEDEEQEPEVEEPESDEEEIEGDVEVTVDLRLPTPKPTSSFSEISGQSEEFSDCGEGDEENEESDEELEEDQPEIEEVPLQETNEHLEETIKLQDVSSTDKHEDPVSSEESSKSSGRTILQESRPQQAKNIPERSIEIQQISDAIKLESSGCSGQTDNSSGHCGGLQNSSSSCTCHMGDRMARAESLLWRIERFLHESLSLGSEDDSGVMTDLSRQISDVDTDNDQPEGEASGGLLLTTKDQRTPSPLVGRQRPRPKSEVICVESLANDITEELSKKSPADVNSNGVKMRGTAAERKALRYQRAKTHSRLFQLLQDECGKEDEDEDDSEEFLDCVESPLETSRVSSKTPVNLLESPGPKILPGTSVTTPIQVETCTTESSAVRKSRLMPLPLRQQVFGGDADSNSSPSGSSGVLSPTSPVSRDQLLADIITEFHQRHQESFPKTRKLKEKFPSKIFKLLQSEFGEEFYETFDTLGGELKWLRGEEELHKEGMECTIHKSESLKALEEKETKAEQLTKSPDLLEVPLRRKLKGGGHVTRDFRSPKRKLF